MNLTNTDDLAGSADSMHVRNVIVMPRPHRLTNTHEYTNKQKQKNLSSKSKCYMTDDSNCIEFLIFILIYRYVCIS